MAAVTAPDALESAAAVTGEKDQGQLRNSLLRTLEELLPVVGAAFLTLPDPKADPPDEAESLRARKALSGGADWLHTALEECLPQLRNGRPLAIPQPIHNESLHLFPVDREGVPREALGVRLRDATAEDLRLVQAFARLYANFNELLHTSQRDRLTGLYNRRSFDLHLARMAERARTETQVPRDPSLPNRGPIRWWLALFDIDHFKRINDTYGHLYGDEVLLLLARLVEQCFRGEDRSYRYGGEEFAVVLGRSDARGVQTALERLRTRIEQYRFPQVGQVTVSIGCAALCGGIAPADVIHRADKALYYAKRNGRNRTEQFEALAAAGLVEDLRRTGDVELF